jgi:hypothetical protein
VAFSTKLLSKVITQFKANPNLTILKPLSEDPLYKEIE